MYVLRRNEDGRYVAPAGSEHSYTRKLCNARRFAASELEREQCENERALTIEQALACEASHGA